jgi:hypothetical protein
MSATSLGIKSIDMDSDGSTAWAVTNNSIYISDGGYGAWAATGAFPVIKGDYMLWGNGANLMSTNGVVGTFSPVVEFIN